MSTTLTSEQIDLRAAVADLMAKRSPETEVRRVMAGQDGYDPALWAQCAAMGLTGLAVPEEFGGAGTGAAEVSVVAEQLGRALFCGPFLSTAVLVPALLLELGDTAENADVLPRIAAGDLIATVALAESGSARPPRHPVTAAQQTADGWRLTGEKTYVLDAGAAERFYVPAQTDSGTAVFAVDRGAPGLEIRPLDTVDQTRRQGTLALADTPGRIIGGHGDRALEAALDRTGVALVAEQAGGAIQAMEMAATYARNRFQFGRAIGSFQAVKHMCVDMLLEAQSAVSAARHVAAAFDAGDPDRLADLALAQAFCSDAFVSVAATNIQVHGGIGFTWEHPAHLYLRRARTDAQILGDPAWHRERYIRLKEQQ